VPARGRGRAAHQQLEPIRQGLDYPTVVPLSDVGYSIRSFARRPGFTAILIIDGGMAAL
jgi:hypothetical protein